MYDVLSFAEADQEVIRLHVSVDEALGVHVLQPAQELPCQAKETPSSSQNTHPRHRATTEPDENHTHERARRRSIGSKKRKNGISTSEVESGYNNVHQPAGYA